LTITDADIFASLKTQLKDITVHFFFGQINKGKVAQITNERVDCNTVT